MVVITEEAAEHPVASQALPPPPAATCEEKEQLTQATTTSPNIPTPDDEWAQLPITSDGRTFSGAAELFAVSLRQLPLPLSLLLTDYTQI